LVCPLSDLCSAVAHLNAAGIIQADALLENQISVEPMMLNLPSYLRRSWLGTIRLTWTGAAAVPANVTYEVKHVPAYSLNIV
jgi:hypothetical protein